MDDITISKQNFIKPRLNKTKFREKLKQYFFRLKFKKIEKLRYLLKIIINCYNLEKQIKILAIFYLINLNDKSFLSKHKNICLNSSWKKSVNTFTKLNRLTFISNAEKLWIPGIVNGKW